MGVVDDRDARLGRLVEDMGELEPPPFAGVPPGFAVRVMERVRSEAAAPAAMSWARAPGWAKVTAILALAAGAALGVGLTALAGETAGSDFDAETTLAERYASALEEAGQ